jgi:hypothetical protein
LGPGAPPASRLAAFYAAMIKLLDAHADLVLGTETGGARFATGAYGFWSTHVHSLLVEVVPQPDVMVDVLRTPGRRGLCTPRARGLTSEDHRRARRSRTPRRRVSQMILARREKFATCKFS